VERHPRLIQTDVHFSSGVAGGRRGDCSNGAAGQPADGACGPPGRHERSYDDA
jgi:hypothetical protein